MNVYALVTDMGPTSSRAGTIPLVGVDGEAGTDDDVFSDLRPVGTYYLAGGITGTTGNTIPADGFTTDNLIPTTPIGEVDEDTTAKQVYYYVMAEAVPADEEGNGAMPEEREYVVYTSGDTDDAGKITEYRYSTVAIHTLLERDGVTGTMEFTEVTATIPEATDYEHIHFGVWAGLGAAEKGGAQDIADLGIGFVQNFSGRGIDVDRRR